jgi:cytochrome c biogenesis protein CcmG/thiol:disulfide interchange protein DsbE
MAKFSPLLFLPPLVFVGLAGLFAFGLMRDDPGVLLSALEGQQAPDIAAQPLGGLPTFDGSVFADGEVKIVNFWASWCPPCRAEHPALVGLSANLPIYGVNKSDMDDNALAFLAELGDPFAAVTVDANGREALDWGVTALPETFILNGEGKVILRFAGPIHRVMESTIYPALEEARGN